MIPTDMGLQFSLMQFITPWYPMGKTAYPSPLNLPGRLAWFTMETPGLLIFLYTVFTLQTTPLPLPNLILVAMFTIHYVHRAILAPLFLNTSMAPIHVVVWCSALFFQVNNALGIGAWVGRYGRTTPEDWTGREKQMLAGAALWLVGLLGNWWHDEELRRIRREALAKKEKTHDGKVYLMPERGLFKYVLFAHYFTEWVEWIGFWMFAGWDCAPARTFVINEVLSMLPRAWNGWFWYVDRFGRDKVGDRKAVVPFLF
jgi:3-oxo-5-alpha-steroid 4-dehydrogenase 1